MKSRAMICWRAPGIGRVVGLLLSFAVVSVLAHTATAGASDDLDSACRVNAISAPSSNLIRMRDRLLIVTRARFNCSAPVIPFNLSIVADAAAIGPDGSAAWLALDLRAIGERARLDLNRYVRIGAIRVASTWETLCDPTGDSEVLRTCLARLGEGAERTRNEDFALGEAIIEATHQIARSRYLHPDAESAHEMLLILVDPSSIERSKDPKLVCDNAQRAISAASAVGIESDIVCLSETCRKSCVVSLADADRIHRIEDWSDISGFITSEVWASELRVRHLAIHERLGTGFDFDVDSPDPGGATYDPENHTLDWRVDTFGRRTVHVSYALTPRSPGTHTIRSPSLGSVAQFTDSRGGAGTFDLGNATIGVVEHHFFTAFLPSLQRPHCELCVRPDRAGDASP